MGKPTPLQLVRGTLRDAYVVDVRRGVSGMMVVDVVPDSPAPLYPGRYVAIPVQDMELALKRLAAVEASQQLAALVRRKRSG